MRKQYFRDSRVKTGEVYTVEFERGSGLEQHLDRMLTSLGLELFDTDVFSTPYQSRSVGLFGVHSYSKPMPERTSD